MVTIGSPEEESYLAGTYLELACSIQLDTTVDTEVSVSAMWQRNDVDLTNSSRINILTLSLINSFQFEGSLQFNTLSSTVDGATYTCIGTVNPTEAQSYVTSSTGRAMLSISVTGESTLHQPLPIIDTDT